ESRAPPPASTPCHRPAPAVPPEDPPALVHSLRRKRPQHRLKRAVLRHQAIHRRARHQRPLPPVGPHRLRLSVLRRVLPKRQLRLLRHDLPAHIRHRLAQRPTHPVYVRVPFLERQQIFQPRHFPPPKPPNLRPASAHGC